MLERYAGSSTQLNGDRRQKSCVQNRRSSAKKYENYRKCLPARRKTPPSASNRQRFAIGSYEEASPQPTDKKPVEVRETRCTCAACGNVWY
ncbi:MAG: hypothetical protein ACHP79_08200, partial [Terriglobales bacterium]